MYRYNTTEVFFLSNAFALLVLFVLLVFICFRFLLAVALLANRTHRCGTHVQCRSRSPMGMEGPVTWPTSAHPNDHSVQRCSKHSYSMDMEGPVLWPTAAHPGDHTLRH